MANARRSRTAPIPHFAFPNPQFRRLLAAALLWTFGAPAWAQAPAPPATELLNDDAIVAHVEAEAAALIRAGKTEKVRTLRSALTRAKSCALALPAPEAAALTPEQLHARRAGSVIIVGIIARKKRGKFELAGCTGFALAAGGIIATNYHVVDSPEAEALVVATRDGTVLPVTDVLAADKVSDVAILKVPGLVLAPIPLALERPAPGAPIWAISHPDHNFYSMTGGLVSRHFIAATDFGKTPQMAVTADFGAGSSGGPILDRQGSVTGMVCSTTSVYWEDTKGKVKDLQMVFKHCVPAESIRRLITPPQP